MTSAVITVVFMYLFYYPGWQSVAAGFCIGSLIPAAMALYDAKIFKRYLIRTNLLVTLAVNTLANLMIIIAIAIIFVGLFYWKGNFKDMLSDPGNILNRYYYIGIGFGLLLSLGFNFFSILNTLIGRHILGRLFIGMYRHPREVERVFMFIDINHSTTIAEQIGHRKFMSLVNDFLYDLTEAVLKTRGEIYKYVGDEAIITWKTRDAVARGNCIHCFLNIRKRIHQKAGYYQRNYGVIPEFKVGLHGGIAVTGELGYTRREIAYMGDVLNTAARIEEACKQYEEPMLVSESLAQQIDKSEGFRFKKVGAVTLRGKKQPIELVALDLNESGSH